MADSFWYKNAVFYEVYPRAFYDSNADGHGDLPGLIEKLDYLLDLGVDCIWLMPINPSPLEDDGYDIADYLGILKEYGTIEDLQRLLREAHLRGMNVITDLVVNHTSDQHPWFQAARSDPNSPYRDYYVWSDSDEKYADARVIFVDTQKSNWTWDAAAGQYFWHRFFPTQPDLNFDNPLVQQEMLDIVRFWLDLGVDGFRVDAVPYLIEREGTNCENLPETHQFLKRLRAYVSQNFPGRILLCEANQWPEDVRPYFGNGDEFHMGFHFPLMPRIYMALKRENSSSIKWILERTPPIPEDCQWCIFLRNHDELTLEMVSEEERQWMWQEYAPDPHMRLNIGIRRRLAPLLDNDRRKIELANSLLLSLPGSPVIYYGDEIGMGDDLRLPDRNGVRTPMQWDDSAAAGFSQASPETFYSPVIQHGHLGPPHVNVLDQRKDPASLWNSIRKMIKVRKSHPVFGNAQFRWEAVGNEKIAAYWRENLQQRLLILNNLSAENQTVKINSNQKIAGKDLINGKMIELDAAGGWAIQLKPYQFLWLEIA